MFIAIFTGVAVVVAGQIFVKRVLDPYISFREHLGMVSAILLREQNKITNLSAKSDVINEIKHASALLLSKSNAVPLYDVFARFRLLPHHKNVIKASRNLNLISSILEGASNLTPKTDYILVNDSLNAIGHELGITVTYNGL